MATYSEVIYCKNCKYCKRYYHGEYSKIGMFSYTCTKELKEVQPFNFCSWADYKDAEPVKHGRWVKTGQSFIFPEKFRNYFCSECLFELDRKSIRTEYLYCPICGAKMDGEENDSF